MQVRDKDFVVFLLLVSHAATESLFGFSIVWKKFCKSMIYMEILCLDAQATNQGVVGSIPASRTIYLIEESRT